MKRVCALLLLSLAGCEDALELSEQEGCAEQLRTVWSAPPQTSVLNLTYAYDVGRFSASRYNQDGSDLCVMRFSIIGGNYCEGEIEWEHSTSGCPSIPDNSEFPIRYKFKVLHGGWGMEWCEKTAINSDFSCQYLTHPSGPGY